MTARPEGHRRPIVAIGHVSLAVDDIGATTAFFLKFGLRKIFENDEIAVLELRGGTHLILSGAGDDEKARRKPSFDLMFDDIEAARSTAQEQGLQTTPIQVGRIHSSFMVKTPDGRDLTVTSSHAGDRAV